jgi:hypothetical protein
MPYIIKYFIIYCLYNKYMYFCAIPNTPIYVKSNRKLYENE